MRKFNMRIRKMRELNIWRLSVSISMPTMVKTEDPDNFDEEEDVFAQN